MMVGNPWTWNSEATFGNLGAIDSANSDWLATQRLINVLPNGLQFLAMAAPWSVEHD